MRARGSVVRHLLLSVKGRRLEDPNGDGKGANENEGEPRRIRLVRGRMEVSKCKGLNLYMASRAKNPRASSRGGEDCFESLTIRWDCPQGVASVCWSGCGPCWRRRSSPFPSKHGPEGGVCFFLVKCNVVPGNPNLER